MKEGKLFESSRIGIILILIAVFWFVLNPDVRSQAFSDRQDLSFGINTWDPVHIKVEEKTGSASSPTIRFTASNSTYYPFTLVIDFILFENLSPKPPVRGIKVSHGLNTLFTLSPQVPGIGYGYKYSYRSLLTSSEEVIDSEFPYLIPMKEGTVVNSKKTLAGRLNDSFTGIKGDTVYCMRRGLVTAVPRSETMDFRISGYDCLEVLHDDGTYMIYHYLDKSDSFTSPGRIVLPGQPVGRLSDTSFLAVTLIKVGNLNNILVTLPIRYTVGKPGTVAFSDIDGIEKSVFPPEVIARELKNKELKQLGKKR